MRSWVKKSIALALGAVIVFSLAPTRTIAQGGAPRVEYEPSSGLYAAAEAGLGGHLLYQKLFSNGWPTTRDFRQMTDESSETAFLDGTGGVLASGFGVSLDLSTYEDTLSKTSGKQPAQALADRQKEFAKLTGLQLANPAPAFSPIYLPYHLGNPSLAAAGSFDEASLPSWQWDPAKNAKNGEIYIDGVGFAIYAFSLLAQEQLTVERQTNVGGEQKTVIGRSEQAGFTAFCALNAAVAAMNELRETLCQDTSGAAKLGPFPAQFNKTGPAKRQTYFPHIIKAAPASAKANFTVGRAEGVDQKSFLFDQAALLLGVCELAKATDGKTGVGRFVAGDKKLFEEKTPEKATELAIFLFSCMSVLHFDGNQRWGSFADANGIGGTEIATSDMGLVLMALESFLSLKWATPPLSASLAKEQGEALGMLKNVLKDLVQAQANSPTADGGFVDKYNLGGLQPALKGGKELRPLAAQGFGVQGLLAGAKALASAKSPKDQELRTNAQASAKKTVAYLEAKRWIPSRGAYLDDAKLAREAVSLDSLDAYAVLGALRASALETKDPRYLLRYKAWLATIRDAGAPLAQTVRGGSPPKRKVEGFAPVVPVSIKLDVK